MNRLTSVQSLASVAASMACWASSFPVVAGLWRELFNELLRSSCPGRRDRRAADARSRDNHAVTAPHGDGPEPSVRSAQRMLRLSHPAFLPPQPGTHAAGLLPPGRPHPFQQNASGSQEGLLLRSRARSHEHMPSCARLVEVAEFA
jgi:hypothetical protein